MTNRVHVVWLSLHQPDIIPRGYADQAMLEATMTGESWRAPGLPSFEHHSGFESLPRDADGAIVVIPARWHTDDTEVLQEALESLSWSLVVLTGDEESAFDADTLVGPRRKVWVQTPRSDRHGDVDFLLSDGWWPGTREFLAEFEATNRSLNWFYSGQVNNPRREECVTILAERRETRHDGILKVTRGFASGMARDEYLTNLALAKVAPCPSGSYCLAPETPVLCGDLVWRPIDELHIGQEIVGFDEGPRGAGKGVPTKYRRSTVESLGKRRLPSFDIETSMGAVTASAEHLWLVRLDHPDWTTNTNREWRRTADLRRGDRLVAFGPPWETEESWEAGWLAGMLDGEGSLETGVGSCRIQFAQNPGLVFDRVGDALRRRGFKTHQGDGSVGTCRSIRITGGRYETMRLVGSIRPERFVARSAEMWEGTATGTRVTPFAVVQSVKDVGEQEVITIGTSTRTLIANGLLSHNSPDSFRVFEALEAGCVPVVDAGTEKASDGYWRFLFGEDPPFPVVDHWSSFFAVCDELLADWPSRANRCGAWWMGQKRRLAHRLVDDLTALGAIGDTEPTLAERITVLMPTSPIPSHPDTAVLDQTIASVRERLPECEILLMIDGVRAEQADRSRDYNEYTRRVIWKAQHEWTNVLPVVFDEHLHQAEMTRRALRMVRTPLILFVEHDTPLVGSVDWEALGFVVESERAHIVRFHHEAAILEPHRHLMLDEVPQIVHGVPLLRTSQWSQRPHLASADFYRRMIDKHFDSKARTMIEDVVYGAVHNQWRQLGTQGWDRWRLWMYAPAGDMKRSTHIDGRAGDPKFEMRMIYPGEMPLGAPGPSPQLPKLRLGVIARGDRRGIAVQSGEVARHLHPTKVLGIDMGELSPFPNEWSEFDADTLTVVHHERFSAEFARLWLQDLDVVWAAETFYRPWFTGLCAELGVRTILHVNPEFAAHVYAPDWAPLPDVVASASRWRIGELPGAVLVPHGVDRQRLRFVERTEASTFLHVIGQPAAHDRQGTRILWDALEHIQEKVRIVVRCQRGATIPFRPRSNIDLEIIEDDMPHYWRLYDDADVLIHPRRFGGLTLPMQEALSCGMPVLMPDASPQASMLPQGMLLPCESHRTFRSLVGQLPLHDTNPKALGYRIDALASNPDEVRLLSKQADEIAAALDWEVVAPQWMTLFEQLVDQEAR